MSAPCCPAEPRIEGRATRDGSPVLDLHTHARMLRGLVLIGSGQKVLSWYPNGRLTPLAQTGWDLVGGAW
jgi:hypothetical protein